MGENDISTLTTNMAPYGSDIFFSFLFAASKGQTLVHIYYDSYTIILQR